MSARRAQGRAASSERSEQRCFEIMNMNDKHSYSLLMRPADFSPEFSAEKIFQNFFSKIFFSRIFSGKKFSKFFFKIFFLQNFQRKKIFKNFFLQNFQRNIFSQFFSPEFSAEYFFRITQRNPRIEFIGISFPFNQGFFFLLVAANNFFNSKNILICLLQFCFVK